MKPLNNNCFYERNNSHARASRFLVHFYYIVHWTTTTWNLMGGTWTYVGDFSFLFLNLDKVPKNSTPEKVASILQTERVQIDARKFERT